MKYWIPFVAGVAVGGFVVNALDDRQRSKLAATTRRVVSASRPLAVVNTVSSGVGDIADAATDRVNTVIEDATHAVADKIATDDPPSTALRDPA